VTEPQAGSDVKSLRTTAKRDGEDWILDGTKTFISNGGIADVTVVVATVDPELGHRGQASFVVTKDNPGLKLGKKESKLGIRASQTAEIVLENCRVPGDALLGGEEKLQRKLERARSGKSSRSSGALATFEITRPTVGASALGIAQAAYEAAMEYAAQRKQSDKPIREHPMVAEMLLEMETTVQGLRAIVLEAALRQDLVTYTKDERVARELRELTPLVKWYGSEEVIRACRMALQIYGGVGVVTEYEVERFMRDSLILPIYEGTSQIQSLMAVRDLMKVVLRRPASLLAGGPSELLAGASFEGQGGRDFAAARGLLVGSLRGLAAGLVRRGGLGVLQGRGELGDAELRPFLLHAERITESLSHLHVARALLEQAKLVPEKRVVAERAAKRARLVAERNARRIEAGDFGVFARIDEWRRERV
jgi:alkylation response protein AidB-like acyl-CoA dehydrogenase